MIKPRHFICAFALLLATIFAAPALGEAGEDAARADTADGVAEWTVMFYLCGSDLESKHGYATGNLEEISKSYPYSAARGAYDNYPENALSDAEVARMNVNVVIETGGSGEWHARDLGMDVDPAALQRWHYQRDSVVDAEPTDRFLLDESLPLASMADPQTLADFIRWSAGKYPARKYALVLWDHGGGGKTGLFIDELFDGDVMYLDELRDALAGGGVELEAVLFDACMMANLETACAIKDSAKWMIASEEVVAGKGTAMGEWLQQLYNMPQWGGERLGRWICDMTQIKYANETDAQSQSLLTWSVIDLSKIDRVADAFDRFFERFGEAYVNDPFRARSFASLLSGAEEFGSGNDNMFDLSGALYQDVAGATVGLDLYRELLDALMEAVVYNARGTGRSAARGLSFCYAADFSAEKLEIYARNCPSVHYLALLDAFTPAWVAPDWVYETVSPLPDIRDLGVYDVVLEKKLAPDGTPGVSIINGVMNVEGDFVNLYRLNEETGNVVRFGSTLTKMTIDFDTFASVRYADSPCLWLSIDGAYCEAELVSDDGDESYLFNVPIQIGTESWVLRCGYEKASDDYVVYGIWEGYDADSGVFNRNVRTLAQLAGQEFTLLYPIDRADSGGKTLYESSQPLTMYRSLEIAKAPLPAGTVWLEYWIRDMFMRPLTVERVEMVWDGQTLALAPGATWEGTVTLAAPEQ